MHRILILYTVPCAGRGSSVGIGTHFGLDDPGIEFRWGTRVRGNAMSGAVSIGGGSQLKCDGTRAETRFRLSAKRTSPFKSAGGRQFSRLLAAEVCASAVVMLDTPCSEVV